MTIITPGSSDSKQEHYKSPYFLRRFLAFFAKSKVSCLPTIYKQRGSAHQDHYFLQGKPHWPRWSTRLNRGY